MSTIELPDDLATALVTADAERGMTIDALAAEVLAERFGRRFGVTQVGWIMFAVGLVGRTQWSSSGMAETSRVLGWGGMKTVPMPPPL